MLKNKSVLWVILSFLTPISGFSGTLQQLAVKFGEDVKNKDVKLAVMDFSIGETGKNQDSIVVRERITTFLAQNKKITLTERSLLEKVFQEQQIQISGAVGADTAKKIGELTGANAIVSGTLSELANDEIELNARIIEVGTGKLISAGQAVFKKDWKFFGPPVLNEEKVATDSAQDYYRRGVQYHIDGKYNMALEFSSKAIKLKPDYFEAYYGRGSVYALMPTPTFNEVGLSQYDYAIADFNRVIDLRIDYIDGYFNRAMAFSAKGDYEKALLDLTKTIELTASTVTAVDCSRNFIAYPNSPDYLGNYLYRAGVYRNKGSFPEAIVDYDKVLGQFPNCAYLYALRGEAFLGRHDYAKAIIDYNKAIELASNTAPGYYDSRGGVYYAKGEYDKAIVDYGAAIESNGKKAIAARNSVCGNGNHKKGDAVPDACLPTQLFDADSSNYYLNRGNAYYMKAEYFRAIGDYSKAIELNAAAADDFGPGPAAYMYVNRGNAYRQKGENDKALSDYSKAIELDPKYSSAYVNRGNIYTDKNEVEKALADYNKAIELAPPNAEVYFNRGSIYHNKGKYDEAVADYNQSIALSSKNAYTYINRGLIMRVRGEDEKAAADFGKAIEIDPENPDAYSGRGGANLGLGKYYSAIKDLSKALELNPEDSLAFDNRITCYQLQGDYDKVIADCTGAIKKKQAN